MDQFNVYWDIDIEIAGDHQVVAEHVAAKYFSSAVSNGDHDSECYFLVTAEGEMPVEVCLADSLSDLDRDDSIERSVPTELKKYLVSWSADVEADDHFAAALAVAQQFFKSHIADGEPESACVFVVTGPDGEVLGIDLSSDKP